MSHKHYAPLFKTFTWLRDNGTIDAKCERVLKMISKRHRKVLVAGNPGSGKNTVANTIFAYWHTIGREACFTPTIDCKNPGDLWSNSSWKNYRGMFTSGQPVITPMKYTQELFNEHFVPGLFASGKKFDVIVDCRHLPDGTRVVAQVFCRRGQGWTCLYRSPKFTSLQVAFAA